MWKLNKVSTPGPQNRACAAEHSTPSVCVPPLVAQCNIKSGIDTLKIEVILRGHTRCKGRGSHSSAYRATGVAAPARNLSTGSNSSKDEILRCRRTWTLPENWVVMPQAQVPRHAEPSFPSLGNPSPCPFLADTRLKKIRKWNLS